MNILISACLLNLPCRYDGTGFLISEEIKQLTKHHTLIPVCPEQLGGLTTPRTPVEIKAGEAISKENKKVTEQFKRGAEATLFIATLNNCKYAIMKEKSPSCGSSVIYDGSFTRSTIKGQGLTSKHLMDHGVMVFDENHVKDLCRECKAQEV